MKVLKKDLVREIYGQFKQINEMTSRNNRKLCKSLMKMTVKELVDLRNENDLDIWYLEGN